MLNCETDTREMGLNIIEHARDVIGDEHDAIDAHFEHGQWWIICHCGASWSVNDSEDEHGNDGFDFEQIDHGDEEFHRED